MHAITSDPLAPTDDTILWRYLPDGNLRRLLDPHSALRSWGIIGESEPCPIAWQSFGSLWFAGPDLYRNKDVKKGGDPREGTFPAHNLTDEEICRIKAEQMGLNPDEAQQRDKAFLALSPSIRERKKTLTRLCGVTCWHQNSHENARMWKDYVGAKGVVVLSTMAKLQSSIDMVCLTAHDRATLPDEVQASSKLNNAVRVSKLRFVYAKYIDMDDNSEDDDGYINVLRFKGKGFRHENEVRGIARSSFFIDIPDNKLNAVTSKDADNFLHSTKGGFNMCVDIEHMIDEVRVHPGAEKSYLEEIRDLFAAKSLCQVRVRRADLDATDIAQVRL